MSVILFFMKIIVIIICYYCNFNHQLYFIFIYYSAIRSLKNIQLVRHNYIMMSNNVMIYFIQLTVNSSTYKQYKRKLWAKNNNICYFVILFILEPLLGSHSKHNVPVGIL
jgi:hypothetical protein